MASSKIKLDDVSSANGTQKVSLPKYSSQVINLANGYAKATRPANVIIILMVFKRQQMKHGQCL